MKKQILSLTTISASSDGMVGNAKRRFLAPLLLCIFFILQAKDSNAQFTCNATAYVTLSGTLYAVNTGTQTLTAVAGGMGVLNGLASSPVDGYLYGVTTDLSALYKINSSGTLISLGSVGNSVAQPQRVIGGLIDSNDTYWMLNNRPAGTVGSILRLDNISTVTGTGTHIAQVIFLSPQILLQDIALGTNGGMYGYAANGHIIDIHADGTWTDIGVSAIPTGIGGAYSDNQGNIYFVETADGDTWRWKIGTPATSVSHLGPISTIGNNNVDAASCLLNISASVDPSVTDSLSVTNTTAIATVGVTNNGPNLALDVNVSLTIPANLLYNGFTVYDAGGNVIPLSDSRWFVVSEPAVGTSNTVLTLNFANLLSGSTAGYRIVLNMNRVNPNTSETIISTAQVSSVNGTAMNNNDLTNTGDNNNNGLPGDVASNNDASNASIPLPITLMDFTATAKGSTAILNWATAGEVNNNHFDIERSSDGRTFFKIDIVHSKANGGNSSEKLAYSYIDATPLPGINYYRLRQVDRDDKSAYSRIEQVTFEDRANVKVYPNPATRKVNIEAPESSKVSVYNIIGQHIIVPATGSGRLTTLDVSTLSPGNYTIRVLNTTSGISSHKLTVVK